MNKTLYKMVFDCSLNDFNEQCQILCDEGYEPYKKPFSRPGFETSKAYFHPVVCQAFIKVISENE